MSYEFLFTETKDIINSNMNNLLIDENENFIDIKNNEIIDLNSEKRYLIISKDLNNYYKVFIGQVYIIKLDIYTKILN